MCPFIEKKYAFCGLSVSFSAHGFLNLFLFFSLFLTRSVWLFFIFRFFFPSFANTFGVFAHSHSIPKLIFIIGWLWQKWRKITLFWMWCLRLLFIHIYIFYANSDSDEVIAIFKCITCFGRWAFCCCCVLHTMRRELGECIH